MKILFVTSTRIGDAVLSTGLLSHLIAKYPAARITVACGALPAPLFAAAPGVERVIPLEKREGGGHWLSLWWSCVGRCWDVVVDLRASLLSWALATRRRYVMRPNRALTHRVRQLADLLGLDDPPAPRLWLPAANREAAARLIPEGAPVLALGPTANWEGKRWRAERFAELAGRLTDPDGPLPDARVAVFGAAHERDKAEPLIQSVPTDRRIDLIGEVDLLTAAACLSRCALYIGNDSGLMHLAAAVGAPTLGLFGPSRAAHYAPWGARAVAAQTDVPYEQLIGGPEYDHLTTGTLMDSLSVDKVEAAARELWAASRGA